MTHAEFEENLDDAFLALDQSMPQLLQACKSVEEQHTLMARRDALRDIFWKSKASNLKDFNDTVEHLSTQLAAETTSLKHALQGFKDVASVIALVTEIIKLAGAIVTAAAV